MQKFYRTILTIEILTEDLPYAGGIDEIAFDVLDSNYGGMIVSREFKQIEGLEMARLLQSQGNDPEFSNLM